MVQLKGLTELYGRVADKLNKDKVTINDKGIICFFIKKPYGPFATDLYSYGSMTAVWFTRNFQLWNDQSGLMDQSWDIFAEKVAKEERVKAKDCNYEEVVGCR